MNRLLRKIQQNIEKSPSEQKLSKVFQWSRIGKTKNSRNANGRISLFGRKNQSICRIVVLTYRFNDCITSVSHPNLREVFGLDYFGIAQRKEDGLFLFSQVQPFHDGIAHPLCSECAEVESEGNYRFKVVKLPAVLVG